MKLERIVAFLLLSSASFAGLGHAEDGKVTPAPPPADQCAVATGSIRMEAYGYTHLVELKNGCPRTVICEVWTDVDPQPRVTLTVEPGKSESVITRRGSPAREVKAEKSCRYK